MGKLKSVPELFEGRHFDREVIILCVRWYLRFKLSLRDLVEMMAERGLSMAHTTMMRRCSTTDRSSRNAGDGLPGQSAGDGESTRHTSREALIEEDRELRLRRGPLPGGIVQSFLLRFKTRNSSFIAARRWENGLSPAPPGAACRSGRWCANRRTIPRNVATKLICPFTGKVELSPWREFRAAGGAEIDRAA